MVLSMIIIIAILIAAIWIIFGFKRMRHKLLALFLIALILFSFFSFNSVFKGKDISIKSVSDLGKITKIYFSWLGNIFNNLKTIGGQAVKMDWQGNNSS
jgi:c-di-AMP phosphodiesterase-like protein